MSTLSNRRHYHLQNGCATRAMSACKPRGKRSISRTISLSISRRWEIALSPISRNSAAICGDIYEGNKLKPLHSLSYGTRNSLAYTHTAVLIQADNVERARLNYGPRTRKCNLVYSEAVWFSYWLELRLNILGGRFRLALIKSCSKWVVSRLFCCRIPLWCLHCTCFVQLAVSYELCKEYDNSSDLIFTSWWKLIKVYLLSQSHIGMWGKL